MNVFSIGQRILYVCGPFSRQAAERKSALERAVTVQSQYEKMLEEYAEFLETAQAKLRSETITATDLAHLRKQLQVHKVGLSMLLIEIC